MFGWDFRVVQQDTFYPHQDYKQINFYKKSVFMSMVGPSETGKSQPIYNWLKNGTFYTNLDKIYIFSSTL